MLSIQDSSLLPPELASALERVRAGADAMPPQQREEVMVRELGSDWGKKFSSFDERPVAAASIGQVHRGRRVRGGEEEVAVKVQYPGVAER